jgi:hypothetical protein
VGRERSFLLLFERLVEPVPANPKQTPDGQSGKRNRYDQLVSVMLANIPAYAPTCGYYDLANANFEMVPRSHYAALRTSAAGDSIGWPERLQLGRLPPLKRLSGLIADKAEFQLRVR